MPAEPHLEARFTHRIGTLDMDVAFAASAPWTVLFGPSGSGKSTILRVLTGLEQPRRGLVRIGREVVLDTDRSVNLPVHRRPVRWSAQRACLMPRRPVGQCLAEGLSEKRLRDGEADRAIDHFRLREIATRLPHELSGGQQQRVAVIRAAVGARGKHLLLDEPFAGLDAAVRDELVLQLRSWLGETPVLSVTHDLGEVFHLGADVVRIADGRAIAQGPAAIVLAEDRHRLIASLT